MTRICGNRSDVDPTAADNAGKASAHGEQSQTAILRHRDLPRAIAMYLPQYHPIPENDRWWGAGFTEWTNVTRSRPRFPRHFQPHLPADLGFYDLRVPEVREAQAALARQYGIHGFCYYHYWFNGRRLLERPFNEVLESGRPDFPFCLCWANESWSRRWLGEEKAVLMKQEYSPEDDQRHARWLAQAFADQRYIRVNGRPLFLIYRPRDLPGPQATVDRIRDEVVRAGLDEPWIVGVDAHCPGKDCRKIGFDGTMHFEPQLGVLPGFHADGWSLKRLYRNIRAGVVNGRAKAYDDAAARARMRSRELPFPYYPCCYVGWDNSPRRGRDGIVIVNGSPERFQAALQESLEVARKLSGDERIVFVNAWNEWAEGNHLEPDTRHGHAWLEAVRHAMTTAASNGELLSQIR